VFDKEVNITISLRIKYHSPDEKDRFLPVATQADFEEFWLPACSELDLKLIPLFETGYPVIELNRETIPSVVDELNQIKNAMSRHIEDGVPEWLPKRVEGLITKLKYALDNFDDVVYVRV
jgi:hypothetical protein